MNVHVCVCLCVCVHVPNADDWQCAASVQDVTAPLCKQCSNARSQKQPWASSSTSLPLHAPFLLLLPLLSTKHLWRYDASAAMCAAVLLMLRLKPIFCLQLPPQQAEEHARREMDRQRGEGGAREVGGVGSCRQTRRAAIIAKRFALCNMNNFARKLFLILTPVEAAHSLKLRLDPAPPPLPLSQHSSRRVRSTTGKGTGQRRQGQGGWQVQHEFNFLLYSLQFA